MRHILAVFLTPVTVLALLALNVGYAAPVLATNALRSGPIVRAPHAPPAIIGIYIPSREVHQGEIVHGIVTATSNVASVEARISGYSIVMQHVGIGRFAMEYKVPWVPFFFKHTWDVHVIARNMDGVAAERVIPIAYR